MMSIWLDDGAIKSEIDEKHTEAGGMGYVLFETCCT